MEIKPYKDNAKVHPDEQLEALAKIIAEVGWRQNVLVNLEGTIIVGHGRWEAYKKYGVEYKLKEIWAMDTTGKTIMGAPETKPMTPEQEKAYRLADNKLSESEWNMGLAINELKGLDPVLVALTGFSTDLDLSESKPNIVLGDMKNEGTGTRSFTVYLDNEKMEEVDSILKTHDGKNISEKIYNIITTLGYGDK